MQALSIRNLRKTYANGNEALKGINFSVEQGDFYALLGPNGAGKTTAIGIISSLVNKTGGDVEIFGHRIDTNVEADTTCIGLVPQEINLNLWEKVENVVLNQAGYYGLGRHLAHERAEKYLRALRLWDRRGDNARSLSGGMKRRAEIAQALINSPDIMILDEPFRGLDVMTREKRLTPEDVLQVQQLGRECDIVVVQLHWGYEYVMYPLRWHRDLARQLVDRPNGVVVVSGMLLTSIG